MRKTQGWSSAAGMSGMRILFILLMAMLVSACLRQRPLPEGASGFDASAPKLVQDAGIILETPQKGDALTTPVNLVGALGFQTDGVLVGQVMSQDASGGLRWRGNSTLTVQASESDADVSEEEGGSEFSGTVHYTLDEPGPGVIEISIVDPASGTVLRRHQVEVVLAASP